MSRTDGARAKLMYGTSTVGVDLPRDATILEPAGTLGSRRKGEDEAAVRRALETPIGSPPLAELLSRRQPRTVAITISDSTRAVPNRTFLPALLGTVSEAGIADENVVIIIGTGLHRASTPREREELAGRDLLARYRVVDHVADDVSSLVQVCTEPHVAVNRLFAEADFRIVTGFIEPHFMAGFSGGRKGICPALVDLATIQRFHGFRTLADPRAREGLLKGNPCHESALEVARAVGADFLLNVGVDRSGGITGVYCGDLEEAHATGCAEVAEACSVDLRRNYDIVITCGGGYPLDQNFYQTVKGMCMALPALKPSGTMVITSSCAEQMGSTEYTDLMTRYAGRWREFLRDIEARADRTGKDQWQFQMQCRVLERIGPEHLLFISDGLEPGLQDKASVTPVFGSGSVEDRLQETVERLLREDPDAKIAVIPDGPYTMLGGAA